MGLAGGRRIKFSTIFNVRDLGGYQTPFGPTRFGRFLRSGDTMFLSDEDRTRLLDYGVRRALDLRMSLERPERSDRLAELAGVTWMNVSMADDRTMTPRRMGGGMVVGFVVESYRRMLADRAEIRRIISFLAKTGQDDCALFHCAGGMDRTGIVSMLVLGNAGVERTDIIADYAYAFDDDASVDELLANWDASAPQPAHDGTVARIFAISELYDGLVAEHGSIRGYLQSCDIDTKTLDALTAHLVTN